MPHTEMQILAAGKPEEHSLLSKGVWEVGKGTHNTHCNLIFWGQSSGLPTISEYLYQLEQLE